MPQLSARKRYRARLGDNRIDHTIDDIEHIIEIFKIGRRREIYRD